MKAIFEDRTRQYDVKVGDVVAIDLVADLGDKEELQFDNVLLYTDDNDGVKVGAPYVEGVSVKAKVMEKLVKDDKVLVFKYKRRKNYKKTRGHRERYTLIKIEEIVA